MTETRSEPKRTVLFVHGHDFKPSADALAEISFAAVRAGLDGAPIKVLTAGGVDRGRP